MAPTEQRQPAVRPRVLGLALAALTLGAGCASDAPTRPDVAPTGPPSVRPDVVARHARQFDTELPERVAGSQQEQIAGTYLLGHLQLAGYAARLDAVPVANTVSSTNVIAVPPSGAPPSAVVAVPYDTTPGAPDNALSLGLFLELARALNVASPGHGVEFVALGAERSAAGPGNLGARRLAQLLREQHADPYVVLLSTVTPAGPVAARGDGAEALDAGGSQGLDPELLETAEVFRDAGFRAVVAGGGTAAVARVLLRLLQRLRPG